MLEPYKVMLDSTGRQGKRHNSNRLLATFFLTILSARCRSKIEWNRRFGDRFFFEQNVTLFEFWSSNSILEVKTKKFDVFLVADAPLYTLLCCSGRRSVNNIV